MFAELIVMGLKASGANTCRLDSAEGFDMLRALA